MRIAFFDEILETHVPDSLARSLRSRGHDVYRTGKIGHGFELVTSGVKLKELDGHLSEVIRFRPDWVLVFRPASLPPQLLRRLKLSGAKIAVWLSDDPVLFDLSYGPMIEQYDLVLHCGTVEVLEFYEREFGRPTGVNMPFWTDHEVFPRVWNTEEQQFDVLFLGNVHDEVRRARYFSLASLPGRVAIHGQVASDYFDLGQGYLDGDEEVVAAGSRCRIALNIPQFFKDHRGLRTWFPGLDDLGFFEYPSRVVQYMAMGIPVISVIPGSPRFETFPEMLVAESMSNAGEIVARLLDDHPELENLSNATAERFDRHFSAESRALMLEDLFEHDEWRTASARERASWFTRYDGRTAGIATPGGRRVTAIEIASSSRRDTATGGSRPVIGLFGLGWTRPASRLSTLRRVLHNQGLRVIDLNPSMHKNALVADPGGVCKFAVNVTALGDKLDMIDILLVAGVDARITAVGKQFLLSKKVKSVGFDDTGKRDVQRLRKVSEGFDVLAIGDVIGAQTASELGVDNVVTAPLGVDREYLDLVEATAAEADFRRWRHSATAEEASVPGAVTDVSVAANHWSNLAELPLSEIVRASKSEVGVFSFGGASAAPKLAEVVPFVFAATQWAFFPRVAGPNATSHFDGACIRFRNPGELAKKAALVQGSSRLSRHIQEHRKKLLAETLLVEHQIENIMSLLGRAETPEADPQPGTPQGGELTVGAPRRMVRSLLTDLGAGSAILRLHVDGYTRALAAAAEVCVTLAHEVLWRSKVADLPESILVVWQKNSDRDKLSVEFSPANTGDERVLVGIRVGVKHVPSHRRIVGMPPGTHVIPWAQQTRD